MMGPAASGAVRGLGGFGLILAALTVLACGGSGGDEDASGEGAVDIRYFRWADPAELAATREALSRFEALHPGITVKLEYTSFGGYGSKLQTLIAGREAPDVFALSGAWFHDLRARGVLADLAPRIEADPSVDLADFYAAPVNLFRHGEAVYGLPRDFNVVALFYNRAIFDQAQVAYPDSTWTWDDLRRAASALTRDLDGDGRTDVWGIQVSNDVEVGWGNYVYQAGGQILSADRTRLALVEPPAVRAFEFLSGLLQNGVSPSPLDLESLSGTPFRNGRLAMITSGSWTLAALDATDGFVYGVAPLPRDAERAAVANGVSHAISATSDHADAAWELVRFLSSAEGQRILARSGTSIPARRSVAESDDFLAAGRPEVDRRVFLDAMDTARTLPFTPGLERWVVTVMKALDRVWLGELEPEAALRGVEDEVNEILARSAARAASTP
jgi:multiple sugar transport system substrate-binding protein